MALVSQVQRLLQCAARSQLIFAHLNHVLPQRLPVVLLRGYVYLIAHGKDLLAH